jgi:NADH:ubiquinone oxidoreductase subunit 6 (subunit J)
VETFVFLVFSVITLGGALLVVTTRNLFHAALYLMLSLFGVAGLFVLLTAPFLAAVQIVVYIGAIAILIVFAVMFTPQVTHILRVERSQWISGAVIAALLFMLLMVIVTPLIDDVRFDKFDKDKADDVPASAMQDLGEALVDPNQYMLPFEIASVLLMAALIGAVVMIRPEDGEGD